LSAAVALGCQHHEARTAGAGLGRNVDGLARLIHLPARPAEVWYESTPIGEPGGLGPTDYLWVIVMRFDRAVLARLTAGLPRSTTAARLGDRTNRPWFPAAVRAAIQRDGADVVVRGQRFDSPLFHHNALGRGSFTVVEGGEYVLVIFSTS
jgi:hypothetical protein